MILKVIVLIDSVGNLILNPLIIIIEWFYPHQSLSNDVFIYVISFLAISHLFIDSKVVFIGVFDDLLTILINIAISNSLNELWALEGLFLIVFLVKLLLVVLEIPVHIMQIGECDYVG